MTARIFAPAGGSPGAAALPGAGAALSGAAVALPGNPGAAVALPGAGAAAGAAVPGSGSTRVARHAPDTVAVRSQAFSGARHGRRPAHGGRKGTA